MSPPLVATAPRVKFGLMLDAMYGRDEDIARRIDETVRLTEAARDAGFDSIFSVHHYMADIVTLQPLPLLARLIAHSGTMQLGTSVYFATVEHPVRLAENVATLDQLSGGRVVLGLGAGYRPEEFAAFGVDRATRWSRLAETVDVLKLLWTGEEVNHRGQHFAIEGQRIGVVPRQSPRPPIWVGANGPQTVLRAAGIGDTWIAPPNVKARWAIGNLQAFRDEQSRLGRHIDGMEYPIMREIFVADSPSAESLAVDAARREYAALSQHDLGHFVTMFDDLRRKGFLIGSPDTVAEGLDDLCSAGFNHIIGRVRWADLPIEAALDSIQFFGETVMPRFRAI